MIKVDFQVMIGRIRSYTNGNGTDEKHKHFKPFLNSKYPSPEIDSIQFSYEIK